MTTTDADKFHDPSHAWGPLERSHFAGTSHRKCLTPDCPWINAYDDDPHPFIADDDNVCQICAVRGDYHPNYDPDDYDDD